MIMDLDGNALDGEFGSAFPSGNFVAGGDFVAQATITTPVVMGPTLPQIQAIVFGPSNQKSPQLSGLFSFLIIGNTATRSDAKRYSGAVCHKS